MVERTYLKSVAIFLISLIIMIPLYSSYVMAVHAGTLTNAKVWGSTAGETYSPYIKSKDELLNFRVYANVPDDDDGVDKAHLQLGSATYSIGALKFGNCISNNEEYLCTLSSFKYQAKSICDPSSTPPPFKIYLFDDHHEEAANDVIDIYCDTQAPVFESLQLKGGTPLSGKIVYGASQNVVFSYRVKDTACSDSYCDNRCVGFKKIVITGTGYTHTYDMSMPTEECVTPISGTTDISIVASNFAEGAVTATAKVFDNFDLNSQYASSFTFVVDKSAPEITDFKMYEAGTTREIKYNVSGINVDISIIVHDPDAGLDVNSVTADLRSIGLSSSVPASCTPLAGDETGEYSCVWTNKRATFSGTSYSLTFKAKDRVGNERSKVEPGSVQPDKGNPTVKGSVSIQCKESYCNGKEVKTIDIKGDEEVVVIANFTDAETGVDISKGIFADLSALNPLITFMRGTCSQINTVVNCQWIIDLNVAAAGTKTLFFTVYDRVENSNPDLKENYVFSASKFDKTGPVVKSISIVGHQKDSEDFYYISNTLPPEKKNVIQVAYEESGVGIDASTAAIVYGGTTVGTTGCYEPNYWVCNFTFRPTGDGVIKASPTTADTFGNLVQNPNEHELKFKVDSLIPTLAGPRADHVSIASSYPAGKDYYVKDYAIVIKINISDESPIVKAVAHFGTLVSQGDVSTDCTLDEDEGYFNCAWNQQIASDETTTKTITFNFTDLAGNVYSSLEQEVTVYKSRNIKPEFFDLTIDTANIYPIDKNIVQYLPGNYYQMIPFLLKRNANADTCATLDIIKADIAGECSTGAYVYVSPSAPSGGYDRMGWIQAVFSGDDIASRTEDYITFGAENLDDDDSNDCELLLTVSCNNFVYNKQESHKVMVNIPLVTQAELPDDALVTAIDDIIEEVNGPGRQIVAGLSDVLDFLTNLCEWKEMINTCLEVLAIILPPIKAAADTAKVADPTKLSYIALNGAYVAGDGVRSIMGKTIGFIYDFAGNVCGFVTCNCPDAKIPKTATNLVKSTSEFGDMIGIGGLNKAGGDISNFLNENFVGCTEGGFQMPTALAMPATYCKLARNGIWGTALAALSDNTALGDSEVGAHIAAFTQSLTTRSNLEVSERSIVMALMCMCIPGLIKNLEKRRQLLCKKGVCYKEYTKLGVPKEECDKQYSWEHCVYVEEIPGIMDLIFNDISLSNLASNLIDQLENSWPLMTYGLVKQLLENGCKNELLTGWVKEIVCDTYVVLVITEDVLYIKMQIEQKMAQDENKPVDWCKILMPDCESEADCDNDETCDLGECVNSDAECDVNDDCDDGEICNDDGECVAEE